MYTNVKWHTAHDRSEALDKEGQRRTDINTNRTTEIYIDDHTKKYADRKEIKSGIWYENYL